MDKKKLWTTTDLEVLNFATQPIWLYSCALQRILWGNKAAEQYFNRDLEQLSNFKFLGINSSNGNTLRLLSAIIQDEVENGGKEHHLVGASWDALPGVIPLPDLHNDEFLYKPCMLQQEHAEVLPCCMVQLLTPSVSSNNSFGRLIPVKAKRRTGSNPTRNDPHQPAHSDNLRAMLDVLEGIMAGKEVDLDAVSALHQSIMRGEVLLSQPTQLAEQLVIQEELDQDVGLNLLQLLGSDRSQGVSEPSPESPVSPNRSLMNSQNMDGMALTTPTKCAAEVVPSHLVPQIEQVLNASIDEWRFDAFSLNEVTQGHPLSTLGFWLLKKHNLINQFRLDPVCLARFLRKVEEGYPDNPYHNRVHAADVLQTTSMLMTKGGLNRRLKDDMALMAAFLSAIVHDYQHKGFNNDFLVRVDDELAVTYNDLSPMENFHVAGAFKLMRSREFNFMSNMQKEKRLKLRRLLIDMVLATDMKQHFTILSKFQAKLQVKLRTTSMSQLMSAALNEAAAPQDDSVPIVEDEADKSLILQVCLKCADVGHLAAPWDVHNRWVSGLEEEFFRQGDQEKLLHLNVSPLMDRCKDGITRSQVGFFDIVVLPLFYSLAMVFTDAVPLVRAVEENCNKWKLIEAARSQNKAP